jgi:hypothetical protein
VRVTSPFQTRRHLLTYSKIQLTAYINGIINILVRRPKGTTCSINGPRIERVSWRFHKKIFEKINTECSFWSHLTLCLLSHYPPGTLKYFLAFLRVFRRNFTIIFWVVLCPKHLLVIDGNYQTFKKKFVYMTLWPNFKVMWSKMATAKKN